MDPKENGRSPASPIVRENGYVYHYGFKKREEFARSQMAALRVAHPIGCADELARQACKDADALLRALAAGGEG